MKIFILYQEHHKYQKSNGIKETLKIYDYCVLTYFSSIFPKLFISTYNVMKSITQDDIEKELSSQSGEDNTLILG